MHGIPQHCPVEVSVVCKDMDVRPHDSLIQAVSVWRVSSIKLNSKLLSLIWIYLLLAVALFSVYTFCLSVISVFMFLLLNGLTAWNRSIDNRSVQYFDCGILLTALVSEVMW